MFLCYGDHTHTINLHPLTKKTKGVGYIILTDAEINATEAAISNCNKFAVIFKCNFSCIKRMRIGERERERERERKRERERERERNLEKV